MPSHAAQPGEVRKCSMCPSFCRQRKLDIPGALIVTVYMCPRCDLAPGSKPNPSKEKP